MNLYKEKNISFCFSNLIKMFHLKGTNIFDVRKEKEFWISLNNSISFFFFFKMK